MRVRRFFRRIFFCLFLYFVLCSIYWISILDDSPALDLVITYVNGSDPEWLRAYQKALSDNKGESFPESISENRFRDNDELHFLLRSVDEFGAIFRRIFLVISTPRQIPYWLNLRNPRLRIIYHNEIFLDKAALPTFNSIAIEANLHRIPGLSEFYIYANDDFLFVDEIKIEDFLRFDEYSKIRSFVFYPDTKTLLTDHNETLAHQVHWLSGYLNSMNLINYLISEKPEICKFGINGLNERYSHTPRVFIKSISRAAENVPEIRQAIEDTSRAKFRSRTDVQFIHFFPAYAQCAFGLEAIRGFPSAAGYFEQKLDMMEELFQEQVSTLKRIEHRVRSFGSSSDHVTARLKYMCFNDATVGTNVTSWGVEFQRIIGKFRYRLLPRKSTFEL